MKKEYINPELKIFKIQPLQMLTVSNPPIDEEEYKDGDPVD